MRASQDRPRRWALPATTVAEPCGSAGCETLIRTRVLNAPLGAWRRGSDAAAERVDAGQFRLPRASSCHTARSLASSAYHGDPESPAGGGRPPGRRLAPRDLREWGFVAFASGGSSCPRLSTTYYVVGSCIASMAMRVGYQR